MPELQKIVQQYQELRHKGKEQEAPSQQFELNPIRESREIDEDEDESYSPRNKQETAVSLKNIRDMERMKESGHYLEFNYETKHENFSQVIDCIQVPPNELLKKDLEIRVSRFEKKEGGIFEQSYVTYIVETPVLGKIVERRYTDFLWLKTVLERMHPGLPVPPIAKKGQYRRYDDKHLNKRRMIL